MDLTNALIALPYYSDTGNPRTLNAAATAGATMTEESCVTYCNTNGYIYAGVEYADECCELLHFQSMGEIWLISSIIVQTAEIHSQPTRRSQPRIATWLALVTLPRLVVVPTGLISFGVDERLPFLHLRIQALLVGHYWAAIRKTLSISVYSHHPMRVWYWHAVISPSLSNIRWLSIWCSSTLDSKKTFER